MFRIRVRVIHAILVVLYSNYLHCHTDSGRIPDFSSHDSAFGEDQAMEPLQDWRSPRFEEELNRLDRGDVAFEFLRRNKSYRADYRACMQAREEIASGKARKAEAMVALLRRWGLTFPCRSI
jgi:hypothetical protein